MSVVLAQQLASTLNDPSVCIFVFVFFATIVAGLAAACRRRAGVVRAAGIACRKKKADGLVAAIFARKGIYCAVYIYTALNGNARTDWDSC